MTDPAIDYRSEWGASPPKSNPGGFVSLDAVVLHYTGSNQGYMVSPSSSHENCRDQVRWMQDYHQTIPEQSDIEYNFLVCSHGTVFEGRVLGYKGGANGNAESNKTMPSICALVGVDDQPPQAMLDAINWILGKVSDKAGKSLPLTPHYEIKPTACPGTPLSNWITQGHPSSDGGGNGGSDSGGGEPSGDSTPIKQGEAYDTITLYYTINVPASVLGVVEGSGDPGNPIFDQQTLMDVLTLWHTVNPGILTYLKTPKEGSAEPVSDYDGVADAAHIQNQVNWLAQWMGKTNGTIVPVTGPGDYNQYGGAPLTEGPFASISEQLSTLIVTQRMMDDAVSGWAAEMGYEVSPGTAVVDGMGGHFDPGDHPIPPE